ncbi:MAG: SBBP repeat-containing protein [Tahibacter sp.]
MMRGDFNPMLKKQQYCKTVRSVVVGILSTVVLVVNIALASAATCISPWQARIGSSLDDEIRAAVRDADGNLYLGGFESGHLGVENYWPVGDVRGFVEKRSSDGSLLWRRNFDTPGIDIVEAIALDSARHRVIIAGRTSGTLASPNAGQMDLFVASLAEDTATVMSVGQFGDEYPQHPTGIAVLPSGDLVVSGFDDAYEVGNAVLGQPTLFLARFTQSPTEPSRLVQQWWLQPNEPGPQTPGSYAFAVAAVADASEDVVVSTRNNGARVTRINGNGVLVWNKLVSSFFADNVIDVEMSASGRLYIAGATVLPLAGPALGNSDGFLMEIDPVSGSTLWGRQLGSAGVDWISSMAVDDRGRIFVGGVTNGSIVPGSSPAKNSIYTLTFSDLGAPLSGWQAATPSATDFVESLSIVPACDDRALIAGHINGDLPASPSIGKTDAIVLSVQLTGVGDPIYASGFE